MGATYQTTTWKPTDDEILSEDEYNWAMQNGKTAGLWGTDSISGDTSYNTWKTWQNYNTTGANNEKQKTLDYWKNLKSDYNKQLADKNVKENEAAARLSTEGAQSTAQAQQSAARGTGISRARSGAVGQAASDVNTANQYVQSAPSMRAQSGATQNDYLDKMNSYRTAQQNANNLQTGAGLNALGGAIEGLGAGAKFGNNLFASDAACKQSADAACKQPADAACKQPADGVDDNKLFEMVQQYLSLTEELKKLKEKK